MERIRELNKNDYNNFKEVFMVFEAEPFYEAWTEEDYQEEFLDFINNGKMYGIFIIEKAVYLSDIAVCRNARNKGYGTKLMEYIINEFGRDFDIYMRTNLDGSMSEGIAVRNGFKVISGKIQEVSFKRTKKGIPEVDKRKYLIRKSR